MNRTSRLSVPAGALLALSSLLTAQTLESGYAHSLRAMPSGTGVSLLLHDRATRLAFDGVDLTADDGVRPRVLLTLPAFSFGSFLVDVDADHVVLGENSQGNLWLVDVRQGGGRVLANLALNYDAVLWRPGQLLVSAKTGGFTAPDNEIHLVDLATGATDRIAVLPGASGPLLPQRGGVLYATASAVFPVPPGSVDLLFLRDDRIQSAIGPSHLTLSDTFLRHHGLDTAADLAGDDDGDVFFVDWLNNRVGELSFDPMLAPRVSTLLDYGSGPFSPVTLQFLTVTRSGPFEPFQPHAAPELFVGEIDYLSGTAQARGVATLEASLTTTPTSPIPRGRFSLDLRSAAPGGMAVIAFGLDHGGSRALVPLAGFEQPLLWSVDLYSAFESILIPLDSQGGATVQLFDPGVGPAITFVAQAAFVNAQTTVVGATPPLHLVLM